MEISCRCDFLNNNVQRASDAKQLGITKHEERVQKLFPLTFPMKHVKSKQKKI